MVENSAQSPSIERTATLSHAQLTASCQLGQHGPIVTRLAVEAKPNEQEILSSMPTSEDWLVEPQLKYDLAMNSLAQ